VTEPLGDDLGIHVSRPTPLPSDLPSVGGGSFPHSPGCLRISQRLDVWGCMPKPIRMAQICSRWRPVIERLCDEDAGADLLGPFVRDDQPFRVDRLGEELLPELLRLFDPRLELVEVGALVAVHRPAGCPAGPAQQLARVRQNEVAEGGRIFPKAAGGGGRE
jgi:hypothetical protein